MSRYQSKLSANRGACIASSYEPFKNKTRFRGFFCLASPSFGLVCLEAGSIADAVVFGQRLSLVHLNLHALRHHGFDCSLDGLLPRFLRSSAVTGLRVGFLCWHEAFLHSRQQTGSKGSVPSNANLAKFEV